MVRIIFFLSLLTAVALGIAWIADQGGGVSLSWNGWQIETSLPVLVFALAVTVAAIILAWSLIRGVWRTPGRLRKRRHERRQAKGRHAITQGLIAIGTGDSFAARRHSGIAKRLTQHDPLALLLSAQTAQLEGDRAGAQQAFNDLAEREDTRLLGLRGLFVEAQRSDDPYTAVALAEEALKIAPGSPWASHAVLGFRCARSDWDGALSILENNYAAGLLDQAAHKRQRGVLLTAKAQELESSDRDISRKSAMEAVKLAPTLVPAATLAARYYSEDNQVRKAMRVLETAWVANPHPDIADAYAHVRLGDSARERLARVEVLAQKMPDSPEGALALTRAAIDAGAFSQARAALEPLLQAPTQRVAILMAELERTESGDEGRTRQWMLRAVRAAHDPVWTADGYVSDRWRPVSPVSGRLDAFQWVKPVAALPSDKSTVIDAAEALLASRPTFPEMPALPLSEPVAGPEPEQSGNPDIEPEAAIEPSAPAVVEAITEPAPPPVFRPRPVTEAQFPAVAPIIPLVRAPDDPGVPDSVADGRFADIDDSRQAQLGGLRGFLSRLVG